MIASIRQLTLRRDLLVMVVWRDLRVKYKQSIMGVMWAVLMPALIVSAGIMVRYGMAILSGRSMTLDDIALVSVKAVPWAFFVSSVKFASNSLISNASLITKIYLPREVFPVAAILSQTVDLLVAACVLFVVLIIAGTGGSMHLLWVPPLLLLLFVLALGLGLIASAASLFFRDVKYLIDVLITFAIFFTPVFYEASLFGEWKQLLMLNPVAPIMEGLGSTIVLHTAPPMGWLLYSAVIAFGGLFASLALFKRLEPYFAESV